MLWTIYPCSACFIAQSRLSLVLRLVTTVVCVFVARAVSFHCVTCFDSWLLWLGSSAEVTDSEIKYL